MKFTKIKIRFKALDLIAAEELICNIFFSFQLKGVICDIPLDEPDEGFGTHTLLQPEVYSITGFLPLMDSSDIILKKIKQETARLSILNIKTDIQTRIVDEKDWAEAWKEYFNVTKITGRITIKPVWKSHAARKNEIVIHLDPGMAFGTGTHPTTAMCIQLIEKYLDPDSSFLDIGTGSGILMIAAAGLGAATGLGIDTDPVAIAVARQNLVKNNIDTDKWNLICSCLEKTDTGPYNLIAANLIAQVIVDITSEIALRMDKNTIAILAGIIKERQRDVLAALKKNHLHIIKTNHIDEWITLAVKKTRR